MSDFREARSANELLPAVPIVVAAVTLSAPTFFIFAARIGAEQNTVGFERYAELLKNSRQLLARHVEKGCVGKDAVEVFRRQIQFQKILAPHFAATMVSRQLDEAFRALESDRFVSQFTKDFEVSAGPAAEVQYSKRSGALETLQKRVAILADIVVARALPKTLGVLIVM